jgi:hypothetical protein
VDGAASFISCSLQSLLFQNEEFKGQYGQVPEVMQSRREKSISLLCEMLVRVKKESDVKGKCMELLEDVSSKFCIFHEI